MVSASEWFGVGRKPCRVAVATELPWEARQLGSLRLARLTIE